MVWGDMINDLFIDPLKTACFTGHRPEKMPFDTGNRVFLDMLTSVIYLRAFEAVKAGYDTFFCGMQRGIDVWAGKQVLRLKAEYPSVRLICVSPFEREIESRRGADRFDYTELRESSDEFVVLQKGYSPFCYQNRNRFMVDNSSLIIGAVADRKSGTGQTLAYARKKGLRIEEIDLVKFAEQYDLHR